MSLSKSSAVRKGSMDEALSEVLARSLEAVAVSRVNVWLSDENISKIECIGSYTIQNNEVHINKSKGNVLTEAQLPKYFKMLQTEEVIATDDVLHDPQTSELIDSYLVPNGITSMLDIPLRSNGKMIGVICFEQTESMRKWNVFEIKFGVLISQIISLLIEGYEKSKLLRKQMRFIKEKEELLTETNNRAKYIFGVMQNLYPTMQNIELDIKVNKVNMHISQAMTLGLIINQLIQISYEQSFKTNPVGKITLTLHTSGNNCVLAYRDNGKEITEDQINGSLLELRLAEHFVEDVKGTFNIVTGNGNKFTLNFPLMNVQQDLEISIN